MASLLDLIEGQIGDPQIRQLSNTVGADEDAVRKGVAGALPMLVSALANNARDTGGARNLAGALERDHGGTVLDHLDDFLGRGDTADGFGILGHVLGDRRPAAERGLGQISGLDKGKAGQLMALLAPLVMGALGRLKQERDMGAGDLSDLLGRERETVRSRSGGRDLLTSLLDRDDDGSMMDDALEMGADLLGGFLKKR